MIVKQADPLNAEDRFSQSGRRAEEQMAHYLDRTFGTRDDVLVFNDLRLEKGRDAAQFDHLILHRWGVVLIESKSVTGSVRVNAHGEWVRVWNGQEAGMASPVLQAERQARFLRLYLEDHAATLLPKLLGLVQAHFGGMPVDGLVAISDQGVIRREAGTELPGVLKADQAAGAAQALLERRRKESSVLNLSAATGWLTLSPDVVQRIAALLRQQHRPRHAAVTPAAGAATVAVARPPAVSVAPTPPVAPASTPGDAPTCRHCGNGRVAVVYGKFGYYFKCGACEGNTNIQAACAGCGARERLRKDGSRFFAECAACSTSRVFFVNPTTG